MRWLRARQELLTLTYICPFMKLSLLALLACLAFGCGTFKNPPFNTNAKKFVLYEQDVIGTWISPTLPGGYSYSMVLTSRHDGCLVVFSDLGDSPYYGKYKLNWFIDQPRALVIKYEYDVGNCKLGGLKAKWLGPNIQIQARVDGLTSKHQVELEPELRLRNRMERVTQIMKECIMTDKN